MSIKKDSKEIKDKKLREELGKNARKEVIENYTWKKNVQKIINKIEKIKKLI